MRLYILILIVSNSYGQLQDNVKLYYDKVNEAEQEVINENFKKAINFYNEAFVHKTPFCKDLYNQSICFAIINKKRKCIKNIQKLIDYNYPLDSLLVNEKLNKIISKHEFKSNYIYDINYRYALDSIFERDQFYRKLDRIVYKDSIKHIDTLNVIRLLSLIKEKGFPTEQKIGVYSGFDYNSFAIIVVHNFFNGKGQQFFNFQNIVLNAINNGDIDNRVGVELYNGCVGNDPYGCFYGAITQYAFCEGKNQLKITPIGLLKINKNTLLKLDPIRKQIGLDGLLINQKKNIYNYKNPFFRLIKYRGRKIMCYVNEEEYDLNKNNLTLIE